MRDKNRDLHGSAPDSAGTALLIIDMINDLDFAGGEDLLAAALPAARRIARLKERAHAAGLPVLYINDNFGRWRSDFRAQVDYCRQAGCRGKPLADLLAPGEQDYFVLKPKHSGFYSTTLDTLLAYLDVHTLILTGIATDICVLFTANDAYMRDFGLLIPSDCVAAESEARQDEGLRLIHRVLKADTRPSNELRFPSSREQPAGDALHHPADDGGRQQGGSR